MPMPTCPMGERGEHDCSHVGGFAREASVVELEDNEQPDGGDDEEYVVSIELTVSASSKREAIENFIDDVGDTSLVLTFTVNGESVEYHAHRAEE